MTSFQNQKNILVLAMIYAINLISTCAWANMEDTAKSYIQNLEARGGLSLNGQWSRIIDPYENGYYNHRYQPHKNGYFKNKKIQSPSDLIEYNFDTAKKIEVPGDWNSQEKELLFYEGTVWYQKYFNVAKKSDKKYILQFGAVNYKAVVYINGAKVGEHEGGFTSFQFDVTKQVKGGENFIVVKADNRRERNQIPTVNTDWWNYGGITRAVSLVELPRTHIQDYMLTVGGEHRDIIQGEVKVSPGSAATSLSIAIPELNIIEKIALTKNDTARFSFSAKPELWSPKNPKLYRVIIRYDEDVVHDDIGFRTVEVRGEDILLNGRSVFLRGISIHEESLLASGRAWSDADARASLSLARDLGANFVRLAHYPHNETMLRVADELGLLVWSEIPVYWTVLFDDKSVYAKAEKQLFEMITRDKNRASIVMWSVANETPNHKVRLSFLKKLIAKTRELDPTRLVTAAIDTQEQSENAILLKDPIAKYLDVIGINSYCGWYWGKPEECSSKTWVSDYKKPIIMSEMGAGAKQGVFGTADERWSEDYQASVYRHNLAMAKNITGLRGLSPWILKDFRSPRRPLDNIQDYWNRKGLVSERGVKKKAWYVLRDFYTQVEKQGAPEHKK